MPEFRGFPACSCQVEWLPAYEHELQRRGILDGPLHIYQLIGGAPQSGGTHATGGASDFLDLPGGDDLWVARQMGADATWSRPFNWDGDNGMPHIHSVLRGCPHNGPARYQIAAVDDGYNGLGYLGHAAPDDGPRPLSGRTWQQGIEWAIEQEANEVTPQDKADIAALVVKLLTDGKPAGSDLTRDQLWKQTQGAADEARDILKAQA